MIRGSFIALAFALLPGCADVERLQSSAQSLFTGATVSTAENISATQVSAESPSEKAQLFPNAKPQPAAKEPWAELIKTAERHCVRVARPSPTLLICDLNSISASAAEKTLDEISQAVVAARSVTGLAARNFTATAELERQLVKRGLRVSQKNTSPNLTAMYRIAFERK